MKCPDALQLARIGLVLGYALLVGCRSRSVAPTRSESVRTNRVEATVQGKRGFGPTDPAQEQEIRDLVDQLVFSEGKLTDPVISPGINDKTDDYRQRFQACRKAFKRLGEYKGAAFPILLQHLDDRRQSIPFRNHFPSSSVGDACYWNLYIQLQDQPDGYSSYGYMRKGRDGKDHPKPYWEGSPFEDSGGLVKWLKANEGLSYPELQIKCLGWLLGKERAIGASDAGSYFENIFPLEIRILEHKLEMGENVAEELGRLRRIMSEKLVDQIPTELLPSR